MDAYWMYIHPLGTLSVRVFAGWLEGATLSFLTSNFSPKVTKGGAITVGVAIAAFEAFVAFVVRAIVV